MKTMCGVEIEDIPNGSILNSVVTAMSFRVFANNARRENNKDGPPHLLVDVVNVEDIGLTNASGTLVDVSTLRIQQ